MFENKDVISRKNTGNTQYATHIRKSTVSFGRSEITAVTMLLPGLPWDMQGHAYPQLSIMCISIVDSA
jgi:hypothetical protein